MIKGLMEIGERRSLRPRARAAAQHRDCELFLEGRRVRFLCSRTQPSTLRPADMLGLVDSSRLMLTSLDFAFCSSLWTFRRNKSDPQDLYLSTNDGTNPTNQWSGRFGQYNANFRAPAFLRSDPQFCAPSMNGSKTRLFVWSN